MNQAASVHTNQSLNEWEEAGPRPRKKARLECSTVSRDVTEVINLDTQSIPRNTRWLLEEEPLRRCRNGDTVFLESHLGQNPKDVNQLFLRKSLICWQQPTSLLHEAVRSQKTDVVKLLVRRHADPNLYIKLGMASHPLEAPEPLRTALMIRDRSIRKTIINDLLRAGAAWRFDEKVLNSLIEMKDAVTFGRMLKKTEKSLLTQSYKQDALYKLSQSTNDYTVLLNILFTHGATPCVPEDGRMSPLFNAVSCGNIIHARLFLEHGADVNQFSFVEEGWKKAPIHLAIESSNNEMLELLLENHADVRAKAFRYAIHTAAYASRRRYGCSGSRPCLESWTPIERMSQEQKILLHEFKFVDE